MRNFIAVAPIFLAFSLAFPAHLRAEDHKVSMAGWIFSPKVLTINAGERVTWINDDDSHHVVFFDNPSLQNSPNIKPEKDYSVTFERPGEYPYYCKYHRDHDMVGAVIVKEAAR